MRKIIPLLLILSILLTLAGCGQTAKSEGTAPATTEAPAVTVESSLAVLESIWANYGEDEKFAVIGGNMESPVDGAPGNYDMAYAENLSWNLLVPAEQLASIDEAATMIHMMNANTFTSGVVHLTEGTDAAAFAQVMRDAIQSNRWMCGFPETLTVAVIGGEYVVIAFGVNDAMNPFMTHFAEAFPGADILFNEAIEG